jgi:hypothetical protein
MSAGGHAALTCSQCDRGIEWCEFCDEMNCPFALCYRCVNEALGQALAQPHPHGG